MSLCILSAGEAATLVATLFTLSWTHSVEKVEWQETWRVTQEGLQIIEARVKGSGAGMEPPPDARFEDGWWVYVPPLEPRPELHLAASGATGSSWQLCANGECSELGSEAGKPVVLKPCP
ncbi:DUF1850 domain-containing protein [Chelativorans sp. YIM 93263]|uniref:DUF1850 domain-containing protein n=1 Tax=Chelativorans sp. YIM 93263 TaxID=2906648 RepID=UPI002379DD26|nr:DUF1850 domain-containing protein [Chelativorans sp. YIM 93263]